MLKDAKCFKNVYIVCGFTDLRKGIDSLAAVIADRTDISPSVPGTLFLFCGRRHDKLKGLVWEKDGYLLLYSNLHEIGAGANAVVVTGTNKTTLRTDA